MGLLEGFWVFFKDASQRGVTFAVLGGIPLIMLFLAHYSTSSVPLSLAVFLLSLACGLVVTVMFYVFILLGYLFSSKEKKRSIKSGEEQEFQEGIIMQAVFGVNQEKVTASGGS